MNLIDRKQYLDWLISWKDSHVIKVVSGVRRSGKSKPPLKRVVCS